MTRKLAPAPFDVHYKYVEIHGGLVGLSNGGDKPFLMNADRYYRSVRLGGRCLSKAEYDDASLRPAEKTGAEPPKPQHEAPSRNPEFVPSEEAMINMYGSVDNRVMSGVDWKTNSYKKASKRAGKPTESNHPMRTESDSPFGFDHTLKRYDGAFGFDDLLKRYDGSRYDLRLSPNLPIIAQINAHAFHLFAHDLKKPYDARVMEAMRDVTSTLLYATGAILGHTHGDKITLVWAPKEKPEALWFRGNLPKMCSMLASVTTLEFYLQIEARLESKFAERKPTFDARVWQVKDETEAANVLMLCENEAVRSSIMDMALSCAGPRKVLGAGPEEQLALIRDAGLVWESQLAAFKRGSYIGRERVDPQLVPASAEYSLQPERPQTTTEPELSMERTHIKVLALPRLYTIVNLNDVIFRGADPITETGGTECSAG